MAKKDWILNRLQTEGNPIIDGQLVTFFWHGQNPPDLIADFNDWNELTPITLHKVEKSLWSFSIELPKDSYIEYCFARNHRRIADPFNKRRTPNGMGKTNFYFSMPEFSTTTLDQPQKGVTYSDITTHNVPTGDFIAGKNRKVHLFSPAGEQPLPLMVVYDGQDYLKRTTLPVIVSNLVAQGRIQPVALAMVENVSRYRLMEYACSESTLGFLITELLPFVRDKLNIIDYTLTQGVYGVCGASMGGLMALYTALRAPHIFGRVLSQSGAYSIAGFDFVLWDLVSSKEQLPLNIFMDCGRFEELFNSNQQMADLLTKKGYQLCYREYNGGHNYPSWRNELIHGLEFLFNHESADDK
jgi:enterochelin esterase-like enzyme